MLVLLAILAQGPTQAANAAPTAIPIPSPSAEAVAADTGLLRHANGRTPPVARAMRVTQSPSLDGRLDDAAWATATPITELFQSTPNEGHPASERTEVRIVFDDDAIYIGARMYDAEPHRIRSELGRRDNTGNSDEITVAFDSYFDHRTSFLFTVNPSGVRADMIAGADESYGDESWDPVWEAQARRDSAGWTAEMRIPFSQLRFSQRAEQIWGVNVRRYIQRKAESASLAWKLQTESGYASRFAHLFGLADLPQPRRLELLPYVTGTQGFEAAVPGSPFDDGSRMTGNFGADFKYGLTSNITVDATLNPDFGQVEQDPAFVNLSAFEQFLQERRPFFVEGSDIFRFSGNQFFYSRRIGQPPRGSANEHTGGPDTYVDAPDNSTIIGAAKVSGRTAGGWSIGLLEALTAREHATIDSSGHRFTDEVEPLTNYAIGRLKRDLRGGATTLGFMMTAVNRDLREADLRFLRSAAYAGGVDFTHRFARNRFSLQLSLQGSHIRGDTLAIQRAQLSSARYFNRPDAGYVDYDPSRTSLSGWAGRLNLNKIQGNLQGGIFFNATNPGFEINDAGFQTRGDNMSGGVYANRRWTRPGRFGRNGNIGCETGSSFNYGGIRTNSYAGCWGNLQFMNYWSFSGNLFTNIRGLSDQLTRGGPLGVNPTNINGGINLGSDFRKPIQVWFGAHYFTNQVGSWSNGAWAELTWKPTTSISFSTGPSWFAGETFMQFLGSAADPLATATYGRQYLFGEIHQKSFDMTTRVNVTFSPALSLQFFAQPFIATGAYRNFKELVAPRTTDFIVYGQTPGSTLQVNRDPATNDIVSYTGDPDGAGARPSVEIFNPDFNVRSLRGNAVLRWEYRPGSALFFVWTQSCGAFNQNPRFSPMRDMGHLCQGRSQNVFAVKANWWLSL